MTTRYEYDENGQLVALITVESRTEYRYDASGNLVEILTAPVAET